MAWWDTDYTKRVKITSQSGQVDENISNHVYYYPLSDLPSGFWNNVKAAGADIRLTEGESTQIPAVWYDFTDSGSTGTGGLFFKGTTDSASNKDYYIYYGNSGASTPAVGDTYGRNAVWNSSFEHAFLMESGDIGLDHTGSGEDLGGVTGTGGGSWSGKAGSSFAYLEKEGVHMDGGANPGIGNMMWTSVGDAGNNDVNPFGKTFIGNFYQTSSPDLTAMYGWGYWTTAGSGRKLYWLVVINGASSTVRVTKSTNGVASVSATSDNLTINNSQWYRIISTVSSSATSVNHYVDGSKTGTTKSLTDTTIHTTSGPQATIGGLDQASSGSTYTPYQRYEGYMDMMLIANSEWSANRVSTWDNQISAPATFWSTGTEESAPAGGSFKPQLVINI